MLSKPMSDDLRARRPPDRARLARIIVPMRMSNSVLMIVSSNDDVDAAAGLGAVDRADDHRQRADVVVTDGLRLARRTRTAATKSDRTPKCPSTRSSGASGGGSTGATGSNRPSRAPPPTPRCGSRSAPSQVSEPFAPTKRHAALPRRRQPRRAPAAAVDEDRAVLEFEDRRRRRSLAVPGIGRIPFAAIDADARRVRSCSAWRRSCGSPCRAAERDPSPRESRRNAARERNRRERWRSSPIAPALQRARDAADAGDIAAVLHHGVDASRGLRRARRGRARRRASRAIGFSLST